MSQYPGDFKGFNNLTDFKDITKTNMCWRLSPLFSWVMFNLDIDQPLCYPKPT